MTYPAMHVKQSKLAPQNAVGQGTASNSMEAQPLLLIARGN